MQPKFFVVIDSIITINIGILNATRFFAVLPRSGSTCVENKNLQVLSIFIVAMGVFNIIGTMYSIDDVII